MTQIPDAAVQAAEEAVYTRHERGFLMKPLVEPVDMRKALTAALPHLQLGLEVKQLEWVEGGSGFAVSKHFTKCRTYSITETRASRFIVETDNSSTVVCSKYSLKEAKAAAQADFERRVSECLVATDTDVGTKPVDVAAVRTSATNIEWVIQEYATSAFKRQGKGIPEYVWHAHFREFATAIRALSAEPAQGEQWLDINDAPKDGTWLELSGGEIKYGWDGETKPPYVIGQWTTKYGGWQFAWYDDGDYGEYLSPTHFRIPSAVPAEPTPEAGK